MTVHAVERPGRPIDAVVKVPGSKSETNRALACAALASSPSTITGALVADDTVAMREAVIALGASVVASDDGTTLHVEPPAHGLASTSAAVHARLSGTTSRFALGLAATGRGPTTIDGLEPLRARPMHPSIDALRALGVAVSESGAAGHLPVDVAGPAVSGRLDVDGSVSSQFVSGLLLAGPRLTAGLDLTITGTVVSWPYLDLTVDVMQAFGASIERPDRHRFVVSNTGYVGTEYQIEPDASTASYFFAAAAMTGGRVRVEGLGTESRQGDVAFLDALEQMGAEVEREPTASTVRGTGQLRGIDIDMADISDTAQTLAVVAAMAEGTTRVTGIGFIRKKETDRIAAVVNELGRCGIEAREVADGFEIVGGAPTGARVETYDDHRMAMSFALLGLVADGVEIADPACVGKTFPGFWDALAQLTTGDTSSAPGSVLSSAVRVIAIDGPAGSGKSTVAKALASRLDLDYLDTGAMYRSVAFAALRRGIDPSDADPIAHVAATMELDVAADGTVTVDGVDATIEIRGPEVTRAVSIVAANPGVRSELVSRQREWAEAHRGGVIEGRDIGSVVFPDAVLKLFLTAAPEIRAARRSREVTDLDYETVAADLARRDALDEGREHSPLQRSGDAVEVDTTHLSVDEIVQLIEAELP